MEAAPAAELTMVTPGFIDESQRRTSQGVEVRVGESERRTSQRVEFGDGDDPNPNPPPPQAQVQPQPQSQPLTLQQHLYHER